MACEYRAGANCVNKRQPSDCLRSQIYVDTMMFSDNGLEHLVNEMGASQIVFGSDLPLNWPGSLDLINSATVVEKPFYDPKKRLASVSSVTAQSTDIEVPQVSNVATEVDIPERTLEAFTPVNATIG